MDPKDDADELFAMLLDHAAEIGGMTQQQVADHFGISREAVSQIEKRGFAKFRRILFMKYRIKRDDLF